jgi:hypothetical protein
MNLQVALFIEIDWQQLKELLAGTLPIFDCLTAAYEPVATPVQQNPIKQRHTNMTGMMLSPINAPMPPSFRAHVTGSQSIF